MHFTRSGEIIDIPHEVGLLGIRFCDPKGAKVESVPATKCLKFMAAFLEE